MTATSRARTSRRKFVHIIVDIAATAIDGLWTRCSANAVCGRPTATDAETPRAIMPRKNERRLIRPFLICLDKIVTCHSNSLFFLPLRRTSCLPQMVSTNKYGRRPQAGQKAAVGAILPLQSGYVRCQPVTCA